MCMAYYSVMKKRQSIDMQKILDRLKDMLIEKKFTIPHITSFSGYNILKIIGIEND